MQDLKEYQKQIITRFDLISKKYEDKLCTTRTRDCLHQDLFNLYKVSIEPLLGKELGKKVFKESLIEYYCSFWNRLQIYGQDVYYESRDRFNADYNPLDFFCINRTCFNGLVRFSNDGKFNVSFHLTRKCIEPRKI